MGTTENLFNIFLPSTLMSYIPKQFRNNKKHVYFFNINSFYTLQKRKVRDRKNNFVFAVKDPHFCLVPMIMSNAITDINIYNCT